MRSRETESFDGERAERAGAPPRRGEKERGQLKIERPEVEAFRQRAVERGVTQSELLRRMLELEQRQQEVPLVAIAGDEEVLVTYDAVVHVPLRVQGVVVRWRSASSDQEPSASEENLAPPNDG